MPHSEHEVGRVKNIFCNFPVSFVLFRKGFFTTVVLMTKKSGERFCVDHASLSLRVAQNGGFLSKKKSVNLSHNSHFPYFRSTPPPSPPPPPGCIPTLKGNLLVDGTPGQTPKHTQPRRQSHNIATHTGVHTDNARGRTQIRNGFPRMANHKDFYPCGHFLIGISLWVLDRFMGLRD